MTKFCPECGFKQKDENNHFCSNCGFDLIIFVLIAVLIFQN